MENNYMYGDMGGAKIYTASPGMTELYSHQRTKLVQGLTGVLIAYGFTVPDVIEAFRDLEDYIING